MDTRVSAFESPIFQLSQEFLFVFIAPLEKFLHPLEVGGNPFFGHFGHIKRRNLRHFILKLGETQWGGFGAYYS